MDKLSEFCYFTYIDILYVKNKMQIVDWKMDKKGENDNWKGRYNFNEYLG